MMTRSQWIALGLCAGFVAACGDDGGSADGPDGSDGGPDAGDTQVDSDGSGTDAGPDLGDDVDAESGPDTDTDSGSDADADTDAGSGSACAPPEPLCSSDADCGDGQICAGSTCVAPLGGAEFAPGLGQSIVTGIALPTPGDGPCCGDVDGDGTNDNELASLLNALATALPTSNLNVNALVGDAIASGRVSYVLDFTALPEDDCGRVDFAFHRAVADVDGDGLADSTAAQRAAGEGVVQIAPESVDPERGPLNAFVGATLDGTSLSTRPSTLDFDLPLPDATLLPLHLEGVVIEAQVVRNGDTLATPEELKDVAPSASIRGWVRVTDILDGIIAATTPCSCMGTTEPIITYSVVGTRIEAACVDGLGPDTGCSSEADGYFCSTMTDICTLVGLLPALADVNSGATNDAGEPLRDALSFGVYVSFAGGALAEIPLAPEFDAVDDVFGTNTPFEVFEDPRRAPVALPVLLNDRVDGAAARPIVSVTSPEPFGTASISTDGTRILFSAPPNAFGQTGFSYTMGDGTQTDTAEVTVHVIPVNDPPSFAAAPVDINWDGGRDAQTIVDVSSYVDAVDPGDVLAITAVTDPTLGDAVIAADGRSLSLIPTSAGTADVAFVVTDSNPELGYSGISVPVSVSVTVTRGPFCGDGAVDVGEQCDDENTVDGDGCTACVTDICGDGIVQGAIGEACDQGASNSDATPDGCRTDCRAAWCGDGVTDPGRGELCDDANADQTDGCLSSCLTPDCGNGVVDGTEECDAAGVETSECDLNCTASECGDGLQNVTAGEQCDDGNLDADDGCDAACVLEYCGDGAIQPSAGEECDSWGTATAECDTDCTLSECGDGVLNTDAGEQCDQGADNNDTEPGACRTHCVVAWCGDGVVDPGEPCDPASAGFDVGVCSAGCSLEPCGDGSDAVGRYVDGDGDGVGAGFAVLTCSTDGWSDRGDDCDDADATRYPGAREICWGGRDEDCDAATDCADSVCAYDGECFEVRCYDGYDGDADGLVDCADDDCRHPEDAFSCVEWACTDAADNDFDGLADCLDPDCQSDSLCAESNCGDGIDNDFDGRLDCADESCQLAVPCPGTSESNCGDGFDDDGDGVSDCMDPDCSFATECTEVCDDGIDNNYDGDTDCEWSYCTESPACMEFACDDGLDDDLDGWVDCEDYSCAGRYECAEFQCNDLADNDGDGLVDCEDGDCVGDFYCTL